MLCDVCDTELIRRCNDCPVCDVAAREKRLELQKEREEKQIQRREPLKTKMFQNIKRYF
jgi:hypothetical protein